MDKGVFIVAAAALVITGCRVNPPADVTDRLPVTAPPQWAATPDAQAPTFRDGWLDDFHDPALRGLIDRALANNYDLRGTAARLEAFRSNMIIGSADLYPTVSAGADVSRRENSTEVNGDVVRSRGNSHGIDLAVSWEIDVWGRLRDRAQAAIADFQATAADYRAARLSLAAQVASAWFDALEAELQVRLAERTVRSFELNLESVEERYREGVDVDRAALDVYLTRTQVGGARSSLTSRRRQLDGTVRLLEVLLGDYPAAQILDLVRAEVDRRLSGIAESDRAAMLNAALPSIETPVPAGIPSELLRRRPDLVRAERLLAGSQARIHAAEKDLLPQIRLTASTGTSSDELRDVVNPNFGFWSIAGSLSQPIFQGRRLTAAVDRAEADYQEDLAAYAQTALRAFQEIETALAAEGYLAEEQQHVRYTAAESIEAERLSFDQYFEGVPGVDIITVLESQRRSFSSQQQVLSIANARLQNRLSLYLALGGEFYSPPEATVAQQGEGDPDQAEPGPRESADRPG